MERQTVKLYSASDSSRLRYIAEIILGDILGLPWELITDKRKLGKNPVINYSPENIAGSLRIVPASLLFETGLTGHEIVVNQWKSLPSFFQTSPDSDIPFDIFAASFFLVSRYEEYLEFQPDQYGRFPASGSLAYKNGFLLLPVVELWAREMSKLFLKKYHNLVFKRNNYKALLTIDVDQPFAYVGKGLIRTIGGLLRDVRNNDSTLGERYRILSREEKDPYEVFDYISEKIEEYNSDVTFFLPVGDFSGFDKNPSWKNDDYRRLITSLADRYSAGLHPSFYAAGNASVIENEASRLSTILKREIILSRFHFVRLFTPASYRGILSAGIKQDYSMGYPDEVGFRAGIARPFNFYDVLEDKTTDLTVFPFQVMDGTLYKYMKLDPEASKEIIGKLIRETRNVGGLFISIWHNTSLLDDSEWHDWREVFEYMLKIQSS